jgi:8-oxo-dGDP phosphatase
VVASTWCRNTATRSGGGPGPSPRAASPAAPTATRRFSPGLELAEETGLRAATLTQLGYLNAAHGITGQGCHVFRATGLTQGAASREATEQDMLHYWVTRARFKDMILDGSVTDDASVAAYTLLALREEGGGAG